MCKSDCVCVMGMFMHVRREYNTIKENFTVDIMVNLYNNYVDNKSKIKE